MLICRQTHLLNFCSGSKDGPIIVQKMCFCIYMISRPICDNDNDNDNEKDFIKHKDSL